MNWSDRGVVLGSRAHGEAGVILELMTRDHGRHLGLVHGGRSRRLLPVLQAGNTVAATWRARLDEQLGTFHVELEIGRAARLIGSSAALHGLGTIGAHLRLLPERDPHPDLFDAAERMLDRLDRPGAGAPFVAAELRILAGFGFGLDLSSCAATGESRDLAYVSPRTGRAVGRKPGEAYRAKLLPLPAFVLAGDGAEVGEGAEATPDEVADGFRLTGFFLAEHLYGPRGLDLPAERSRLLAALLPARRAGGEEAGSGRMREQAMNIDDSAQDSTG